MSTRITVAVASALVLGGALVVLESAFSGEDPWAHGIGTYLPEHLSRGLVQTADGGNAVDEKFAAMAAKRPRFPPTLLKIDSTEESSLGPTIEAPQSILTIAPEFSVIVSEFAKKHGPTFNWNRIAHVTAFVGPFGPAFELLAVDGDRLQVMYDAEDPHEASWLYSEILRVEAGHRRPMMTEEGFSVRWLAAKPPDNELIDPNAAPTTAIR